MIGKSLGAIVFNHNTPDPFFPHDRSKTAPTGLLGTATLAPHIIINTVHTTKKGVLRPFPGIAKCNISDLSIPSPRIHEVFNAKQRKFRIRGL